MDPRVRIQRQIREGELVRRKRKPASKASKILKPKHLSHTHTLPFLLPLLHLNNKRPGGTSSQSEAKVFWATYDKCLPKYSTCFGLLFSCEGFLLLPLWPRCLVCYGNLDL
jgi:hypothetical protein